MSKLKKIVDDDDDDTMTDETFESTSSSSKDEKSDSKSDAVAVIPWIEKYRPRKLDDVAHQDEVVNTLRRTLQTGNLQHLLFYGPPGTGKTSTILAVARELYGPDLMKKRVLELNASNERGIDVIRNKVKQFAQVAVGTRDNVPGFPCPPYKIIVLDEADSMTRDAQSALRRTMEQFTKVTRFCIICNYVSRIIEPITSRCAKFRFKPLAVQPMIGKLKQIAEAENIKVSKETLDALIETSEGDMRKSITLLQSAQRLVAKDETLSEREVHEVAGMIPSDVVSGLVKAIKTNTFKMIQTAAEEAIAAGFPVDQVLIQLQPLIIRDAEMTDTHKAKICVRIAEADKKLTDGADEFLQLMDVLSFASSTIHTVASS